MTLDELLENENEKNVHIIHNKKYAYICNFPDTDYCNLMECFKLMNVPETEICIAKAYDIFQNEIPNSFALYYSIEYRKNHPDTLNNVLALESYLKEYLKKRLDDLGISWRNEIDEAYIDLCFVANKINQF